MGRVQESTEMPKIDKMKYCGVLQKGSKNISLDTNRVRENIAAKLLINRYVDKI